MVWLVRSKNLDILFKRDYYEQKIAQREKEREQADHQEDPPADSQESSAPTETDSQAEPDTAMETPAPVKPTSSFHTIDPNEIPEFKPMNQNPEREVGSGSGQSSPFYPGYPAYGDQLSGYGYPPVPPRPNLYLYSPSNNTLIPCEEIIIPNPVMSAEGPVYTGPTNIYLAYPVSGPDGRGYITQPFSPPPLPQDYLPYSAYSPRYQCTSPPLDCNLRISSTLNPVYRFPGKLEPCIYPPLVYSQTINRTSDLQAQDHQILWNSGNKYFEIAMQYSGTYRYLTEVTYRYRHWFTD